MNDTPTAKLKLVTIIAPLSLEASVVEEVRSVGATGYTTVRVNGQGQHGTSRFGFVDGGNIKVETLVSGEVAHKILARVVERFAQSPVVAFTSDVEAVPAQHFA